MLDVTVYFYSGSSELGRSYSLNDGSTVLTLKQAIASDTGSPFSGDPVANFRISAYPVADPRVNLADGHALADDTEYHAAKQ